MSEKSEALAQKFEQVSEELAKAVESTPEDRWKNAITVEGWSAGVTAHHVAVSTAPIAQIVQMTATEQKFPPLTVERLNAMNAEHAAQSAGCTREETAQILRASVKDAASMLRGLNDDQLAKTALFSDALPAMSAQQVIENVLIGHPANHLESMRQAK